MRNSQVEWSEFFTILDHKSALSWNEWMFSKSSSLSKTFEPLRLWLWWWWIIRDLNWKRISLLTFGIGTSEKLLTSIIKQNWRQESIGEQVQNIQNCRQRTYLKQPNCFNMLRINKKKYFFAVNNNSMKKQNCKMLQNNHF